ncbi:MAG: Rid family detoxifying hydrolase [Gammaproteobacteria bacterium]|nr:Rid family detoxifying hydrolase [Gammaproteobacteria bacterium]
MKEVVHTKQAPEAIGTYSQAVRFDRILYVSGQIPLNPDTMVLTDGSMEAQVNQVFDNLSAICKAASGDLNQILKMTVYLINLSDISWVNQAMAHYFTSPYPARVAFEVSALPRGARVEIDAMMACA